MADYSTERVNTFTDRLLQLDDDPLVQVWAKCCGFAGNLILIEAYRRLVCEFFEMSAWDQQAVLYQVAPAIARVARSAAGAAATKARTTDPL